MAPPLAQELRTEEESEVILRFLARILRIAPRRPTGHPPFAFTDQQGRHYYGWEDFSKMPPARANEVDDVLRDHGLAG